MQLKQTGLFLTILSDVIGYTGFGIGLGYVAWSKWGAPRWVLLLSSLVGLILAFYKISQTANKK